MRVDMCKLLWQTPERRLCRLTAALALGVAMGGVSGIQAAHAEPVSVSVPAGSLSQALAAFGRQTGIQIAYRAGVTGSQRSGGVKGTLEPKAALQRILAGSGLSFRFNGANSAVIERPGENAAAGIDASDGLVLDTVTVEGNGESGWGPVNGIVATRTATGTKTDAPLVEVPQTVNVVTAKEIERRGAESVKDAVSYTPGVYTGGSNASIRTFDNVTSRGFAPAPLYLDGTYLPYIGDLGGSPQIDPYLLERVEVLKGPTSVLFGQNYPGGIVNMVSKRPSSEEAHEVTFGTGSYGRLYGATDHTGPLNDDKSLLYRFTSVGLNTDTHIDFTEEQRVTVAPALTWAPDADTTFTLLGHYQKDSGIPDYQPLPFIGTVDAGPYGRIDRETFTGEPGFNDYNREQAVAGYELSHRFSDVWSVRHSARYISVKDSYSAFFNAGYVTAEDGTIDYSTVGRNAIIYASNNKVFATDTNAQAEFATGNIEHTALIGLDYKWFDNDYTGKYGFGNTSLDLYNPEYGSYREPTLGARWDNKISQLGLYSQDQARWENWVLTFGGRYDWAWRDNDDFLTGEQFDAKDTAFTGRAGLTYLFDNGFAPYVSYSESFMPYAGFDGENKPFEPTTGQQFEAGVKFQPPGSNAMLTLSVYDLKQQNVPTYDVLTFLPSQTGEIHVRGVEAELKAELLDGLDIIASAAYTDSRYSKATDGTEGNRVRYQPPVAASLWAFYSVQGGVMEGLGFGGGLRHSGSGYGDDLNTFKYPSSTVADAAVSYDFGKKFADLDGLSLKVNVENLFDKTYVSGCSYLNGCYYGAPRAVRASATYKW